jgi:hypothetical protein
MTKLRLGSCSLIGWRWKVGQVMHKLSEPTGQPICDPPSSSHSGSNFGHFGWPYFFWPCWLAIASMTPELPFPVLASHRDQAPLVKRPHWRVSPQAPYSRNRNYVLDLHDQALRLSHVLLSIRPWRGVLARNWNSTPERNHDPFRRAFETQTRIWHAMRTPLRCEESKRWMLIRKRTLKFIIILYSAFISTVAVSSMLTVLRNPKKRNHNPLWRAIWNSTPDWSS